MQPVRLFQTGNMHLRYMRIPLNPAGESGSKRPPCRSEATLDIIQQKVAGFRYPDLGVFMLLVELVLVHPVETINTFLDYGQSTYSAFFMDSVLDVVLTEA